MSNGRMTDSERRAKETAEEAEFEAAYKALTPEQKRVYEWVDHLIDSFAIPYFPHASTMRVIRSVREFIPDASL